MGELGKIIFSLGCVACLVGLVLIVLGHMPGIGKVPGDIVIRKGSWTFYFPIASCVIISIILTGIFTLFRR